MSAKPVVSDTSFADLGLTEPVIAALRLEGITAPTPVQVAVIPDAMSGADVLGRAQTGSGKTLAFGIPVVAKLAGDRSRIHRPRALVVVPTRELASQVRLSLEPVAKAMRLRLTTVYGGTPYDRQIKALRQGTDIVVATPGRLQDLIDKGALGLEDVQVVVLDEADHLCDLGFYPAVDALLAQTPDGSQRLLLSATLDGDVDRLVKKHLRTPKVHQLDPNAGAVTTMAHHVLVVGGYRDKVGAVSRLVEANPRSIVFTKTREGATELRGTFERMGIEAVDLHGALSQRVRERNLQKFSSGKAQVVVATDVAARGIHVDNVGLVVHYDAPNDAKAYLHRSGRTARAGESGTVVTITTVRQVDEIVRMQSRAGVESRHHDVRTAPVPMTAAALAQSGTTTPPTRTGKPSYTGPGRGRPTSGGYQGRSTGGYQGRSDRPARTEGGYQGRSDRPARAEGGYQGRSDRPARAEGGYQGRSEGRAQGWSETAPAKKPRWAQRSS